MNATTIETKTAHTTKKTVTINGANFSDLNGFYTEMETVMAKHVEWNPIRNLHGLNDLLCGGFGAHKYKEPFTLVWANSLTSQTALDFPSTIKYITDSNFYSEQKVQPLYNILVDIIKSHSHIELVLA